MLKLLKSSDRRAMVFLAGLIAASLSIRALAWISAPESSRSETEVIFIFLAFAVLLFGLVVLRLVGNRTIRVGTLVVGALLLSSSIGSLAGSLKAEIAGLRAPAVFTFHQPVHITSARGHGGKDEVRVEMALHGNASLERRLRAVATGELQLYLRIPAACDAGPCEMSVLHPETGERAPAIWRPSGFEIRFQDGRPFALNPSVPVTLVFEFSSQMTLYARDIGLPASARSDRLIHSGKDLPIPYDGLIFARFMFLDENGIPHSAIY